MATPVISSLVPVSGAQGETLDGVQVNGQGTNFDATSAVSFSNIGISASSVLLVSATALTATVAIAPGALTGPTDVTVTTGSEVATGVGRFIVGHKLTPVVSSIDPATGAQGDTVAVVITGVDTKFNDTSVVSFSGPGIVASNITSSGNHNINASVAIDAAATPGLSDVTVTTGSEVAVGAGLFEVIGSGDKAVILREAVNTYLRQNHVTGQAQDVCVAFIASINQSMRDQVSGKASRVAVTVGAK